MDPTYPAGAAAIEKAPLGTDQDRYDRVSVLFHWATAFLIVALFLTAQAWGFLERENRGPLKYTHHTLGVLLTAVIIGRLAWRTFYGRALAAANTGWTRIAAKATHHSLYLLIVVQLVLGFLAAWSGRRAMVSFFGLEIPSPFEPFTRDQHHLLGEVHGWVGWTIIILALGHAIAALVHHYVLRDNLMTRMSTRRV
ncbi:cytochrome b [Hyphomicrobium methylovorum]|uniref:cytochrome b n=1 Tax=Hyphomicrobium methylovorum TaxID=84 RepID=UPI0015E760ED|nr:cytochrome b [Hyphomicrobium methylovorum]